MGIITTFIAVVFSFALTQNSFAGGADGGGGDTAYEVDTMWFGDEARGVRYCFEIDRGFGASEHQVEAAFTGAIRTWLSYAKDRGAYAGTRTYVKLASCDGTQDLTLFFGGDHPKVVEAKKAYVAPVAFAVRESYDLMNTWGKGFIWVAASGERLDPKGPGYSAPSWNEPFLLQALLTHELGHVLGCSHQKGTIMDADLPARLTRGRPFVTPAKSLTEIDQEKELITKSFGASAYSGELPMPYSRNGAELQAYLDRFKRLVGRLPVGKVRAKVTYTRFSGREPTLELVLADDSGTHRVPVTWQSYGAIFELGNKVLAGWKTTIRTEIEHVQNPDGTVGVHQREVKETQLVEERTVGFSADAKVKQADGKEVPARFTINSSGSEPASMEILEGTAWWPLFWTKRASP